MKFVKRFNAIIFLSIFGLILFSFGSCYPDDDLVIEDLDTVFSFYDKDVNFGEFNTYAMPDSVVVLDELSNQSGSGDFDEEILARIRTNMSDLGYEEIANPTDDNRPDVVLLVSKAVNTNVDAYSYYDWWGYYGWYPYWGAYPYYYGAGWSPYYPWGGTVVYSYKTGTLFMEMINANASDDSSQEIPTVWAGAINGLVEGSDADISARLDSTIDQVFEQSPYLQTN